MERRKERRNWSSVVVAVVSAAVSVPIAIWVLLSGLLSGDYRLQLPLVLASLAVVAAVFIRKGRIGHLAVPPNQALTGIAHALRASLYRVTEEREGVTVRLGFISAVKVTARPSGDGTDVYLQPYPTPAGWMILFFLWSLLTLPIVLFILMRAREFARDRIASLTDPGAHLAAPSGPTEVRALLIDGLSEGHRLASEAYEAERSRYHDLLLLAIMGGIIAWGLVFILAFTSSGEPVYGRQIEVSSVIAFPAGAVAMVLAVLAVRRARRPRVIRLKGWADRLREALEMEVGLSARNESLPSSFDVLSEASRQVPEWYVSLRKGGLSRETGTWLVVTVAGVGAVSLFYMAAAYALVESRLAAGAALGGFLLAAGSYILYRRWRRRLDSERDRALSDWNRRLESVRSSMDQFLQDL